MTILKNKRLIWMIAIELVMMTLAFISYEYMTSQGVREALEGIINGLCAVPLLGILFQGFPAWWMTLLIFIVTNLVGVLSFFYNKDIIWYLASTIIVYLVIVFGSFAGMANFSNSPMFVALVFAFVFVPAALAAIAEVIFLIVLMVKRRKND